MHIPPEQPADQSITSTLTADEADMLTWLGQHADPPLHAADLLACFAADLAGSWRNGGSDERETAFAWYKRRGFSADLDIFVYTEARRFRADAEEAV